MTPPKIAELAELPEGVLAVRRGPGANCSSIGSVVDLLFGAAVVSGMLYAGIVVALGDRKVEQVRRPAPSSKRSSGDPAR